MLVVAVKSIMLNSAMLSILMPWVIMLSAVAPKGTPVNTPDYDQALRRRHNKLTKVFEACLIQTH
jgi:hypothetical protein